jgi:tetratricopeptide (TPR) repeat protein
MKSLLPLTLALLAVPALGEVVHLNDGTTVEGELQRSSEGWVVTAADGKVVVVTPSQVKSIEFKKSGMPGDTPDQRLASLQRAVANQSDIPRVIERFQSFIAQNPNTPAAKAAAQDLAIWQSRLDKGMVRAGDQWVTKEQLADLRSKSMQVAEAARALIAAGKLTDAAPKIDQALAASPQDPALLYLKGLVEYRQTHIVPARNAFQSAEAASPDSGTIHNNIAVILWKQRAQMPALSEYDKAMLAKPQDQTILDNVHEALHGLPAEYKDKDLTKRVKAHFLEQDTALQRTMAAKGLYRWGSEWLDQKEYDKLQARQKAVQDKIDSLQKDFDGLKAAMMKIDRDIVNDQQVAQSMLSASIQTDPYSGRTYSLPLPQRYYDLQKDVANLKSQKVLDQKQLEDLQKFALQQKQLMPEEKYTGVFKPFDVDGMPGASSASSLAIAAPTTAPAPTVVSGSPQPASGPPAPAAPITATPSAPNSGGVDFGPRNRPVPGTH